ncbi:MAG: hypothetical protein ABIK37_01260 [candidate division WOR-3 bacterium]
MGVVLASAVMMAAGIWVAAVPGDHASMAGAAPAAALRGRADPLPPVPLRPLDGETLFVASPLLEVEPRGPFGLYHFRVMEGGSVAAEGFSPLPKWLVVGPGGRVLQRGHDYAWSCRVYDGSEWSDWFSPSWRFAVAFGLRAPEPVLPEDSAVVRTRRPLLVVEPVSMPVRYCFRVWDGRTLVAEGSSEVPAWRVKGGSGGLEPGTRYSWSCRVVSVDDSSGWFTPLRTFAVATERAAAQSSDGDCEVSVTAQPSLFADRVVFLMTGEEGPCRVAVYARDGRRLWQQELAVGLGSSGRAVWDGRDESGRVVPAGVYIGRVSAGGLEQSVRLVKVR